MKTKCILCLALCACSLSGTVSAGPCYDVEVLWGATCPIFGPTPLFVSGMSQTGRITGSYEQYATPTSHEGFFWSTETGLVTIPRPRGVSSLASQDVNSSGAAAVEMIIPSVSWQAYLMADSQFMSLGLLPDQTVMQPISMNEHNDIVGMAGTTGFGPPFAWVNGQLLDLSIDLGEPLGRALDINNHRQVTGWMTTDILSNVRAFIWQTGRSIDLDLPAGATASLGNCILDNEIVGGAAQVSTPCGMGSRAHIWKSGVWQELPTLSGYWRSQVSDMNDSLQAVGVCWGACPSGFVLDAATLWQEGIVYDLNQRIDPDSVIIQIESARAINNAGQIAANGSADHPIHGYSRVGFLLTPKPAQPADLTDDCTVDGEDLMILLQSWGPVKGGKRNANPAADLNDDGVVNGFDLAMLLAAWG